MAIIVNNQNDQSLYGLANGPSELAVLENARKAFGSLPGGAPFDVLSSVSDAAGPTSSAKTSENQGQAVPQNLDHPSPSGHHHSGEAVACELLMNLVRLKWVDEPLRNNARSQGPVRIGTPTDKAKIEQIDRLRAKGCYEEAIGQLSDLLPDIDSNEFLELLLRLSRDLGATHHVIEHAAQKFGADAPAIETAGANVLPGGHKIARAARSIDTGIPFQFAGASKGQDALLESVFKWAKTAQAPNDLANIVHEQALQGSRVARIVIAEAAFQRGKFALAKKFFSSPEVREMPVTLVHRRLGELALISGDARLAATHFEVTLLIPNQDWQTARLPSERTRRVGRLADYYIIYWFDGRYMAVPQDRPFRGVTRLGGRAVQLFERKNSYNWDEALLAYAVEARRKVWHRFFAEKAEAPNAIVADGIPIRTRILQVLLNVRYSIPGLSHVSLRKIAQPAIKPTKLIAKIIARQLPRPVVEALLRLGPALEWRPNLQLKMRRYVTHAKPQAFTTARYLYRTVAAPVLVFLLNGRVIPESLCAEDLTDLVNKLPPIPNTTGKAGN